MDERTALETVEKLKSETKIRRKRRLYGSSRLDKYKGDLILMHKSGASIAELQRWLRAEKRVKVVHSTVARYLKKHINGSIRQP